MPYPLCLADLRVPPSLIAQHPLSQRDDSRLMLSSRQGTEIGHHRFNELPGLLPRAALLVLTNSRVIPARLTGRLPGGRAIEVLLVDELASGRWNAMVKGARHIKPGMRLNFAQGALAAEGGNGYVLLQQRLRAGGIPEALRYGAPVEFDGREAYRQQQDGLTRLVWSDGDIVALLEADALPFEELFRVARSMTRR